MATRKVIEWFEKMGVDYNLNEDKIEIIYDNKNGDDVELEMKIVDDDLLETIRNEIDTFEAREYAQTRAEQLRGYGQIVDIYDLIDEGDDIYEWLSNIVYYLEIENRKEAVVA